VGCGPADCHRVHHLLIRSDVDTIEPRAKAPHPASGGRLILATCSPAAAKARLPLRRVARGEFDAPGSQPPAACLGTWQVSHFNRRRSVAHLLSEYNQEAAISSPTRCHSYLSRAAPAAPRAGAGVGLWPWGARPARADPPPEAIADQSGSSGRSA